MTGATEMGAIVLAGGRASRLDGAPKPLLEVAGVSLLQGSLDAVAGCDPVVVAGPELIDSPGVRWVREDPPFGGPVAGILAALPLITTERVLILATDLPRASEAVGVLREAAALAPIADGLCLADESGRPQWLTGIYRTAALREAAGSLPTGGANASMRMLLADLEIGTVRAPEGVTLDVDTWQDLITARRNADGRDRTATAGTTPTGTARTGGTMSRTLPPEALEEWAAALREKFGLAEEDLPISLILDLARDVAVGVARPAAPFSAFAAGLVAGRRGGSPADVEAVVAEIVQLAATWEGNE